MAISDLMQCFITWKQANQWTKLCCKHKDRREKKQLSHGVSSLKQTPSTDQPIKNLSQCCHLVWALLTVVQIKKNIAIKCSS